MADPLKVMIAQEVREIKNGRKVSEVVDNLAAEFSPWLAELLELRNSCETLQEKLFSKCSKEDDPLIKADGTIETQLERQTRLLNEFFDEIKEDNYAK